MDDLAVLPAFTGTLVTDALASYTVYGNSKPCAVRTSCANPSPSPRTPALDPAWAKAHDRRTPGSQDRGRRRGDRRSRCLEADLLAGFQERYQQAALCGIAANPYSGKGPRAKARALAERLRDRIEEYQRYMADFVGPVRQQPGRTRPANIKAQQKISGSWRTLTGARRFARIRSYISTVRKHGVNPLTALRDLFAGRPWTLPATS